MSNVGPFSYEKNFVDKKKEPVFSMGGKLGSTLINKNNCSPSPDCYMPNNTLSKFKAPEFKIGTAVRE